MAGTDLPLLDSCTTLPIYRLSIPIYFLHFLVFQTSDNLVTSVHCRLKLILDNNSTFNIILEWTTSAVLQVPSYPTWFNIKCDSEGEEQICTH